MDERRKPVEPTPVYLTAKISGVVIPTWLAVALGCAGGLASVALLLVTLIVRDALADFARELRVLQLHVQDVESVLIEQGLAKRRDFAPWEDAPKESKSNPNPRREE